MKTLDPKLFRREIHSDTKAVTYWTLTDDSNPAMFTQTDLGTFERELQELHANGRVCLHRGTDAPFHDMIIFEWSTHYFPIHRHPQKSETITPLRGSLRIILFHSNDRSSRSTYTVNAGNIFVIPANVWHQIEAVEPHCVYRETKVGPFLGDQDREFMQKQGVRVVREETNS